MAKGVSIKFKSYSETIPKFLELIKLNDELKKHDKIVLKISLKNSASQSNTNLEFVESVLDFCLIHKNPDSQIVIAEGSDGEDTMELFDKIGYKILSEKYSVGLVDLNNAEVAEIENHKFLKFSSIMYPKILLESFVISLPTLSLDSETEISASLSNMLGAFPSKYYTGFFSKNKNKIRKWPIKYSIHDILKCKVPDFTILDASSQGFVIAGNPLDVDKQAAKILGKEWKSIGHLKLIDESFISKKDALNDLERSLSL